MNANRYKVFRHHNPLFRFVVTIFYPGEKQWLELQADYNLEFNECAAVALYYTNNDKVWIKKLKKKTSKLRKLLVNVSVEINEVLSFVASQGPQTIVAPQPKISQQTPTDDAIANNAAITSGANSNFNPEEDFM